MAPKTVVGLALFTLIFACKPKVKVTIDGDWVTIPQGQYPLGKKSHYINPFHETKVKAFTISRYEVTNAEFAEFVNKTDYITLAEKFHHAEVYKDSLGEFVWYTDSTANWRFPDGKSRGGIERKMNHPVTCISYIDAMAYCQWKGVRLPTLDEWEIACRAGTDEDLFFKGSWDSAKLYANIWHKRNHLAADTSDPWVFTAPVGQLKPNAWGLFDMYGNVFELCADQPAIIKKRFPKMVCARGGSWWCSRYSCNYINSVDIGQINKAASFSNMGFRVVKK